MALHKFKIKESNVNIDPEGVVLHQRYKQSTIIHVRRGQKIMYASDRGSYQVGYFLGTSNNGTPVCLTSRALYNNPDYSTVSISRISTEHLLPLEWADLYAESDLHQTFKEYQEQVESL